MFSVIWCMDLYHLAPQVYYIYPSGMMNDIKMNFSPISIAYYRSSPCSRIQGPHLPSVHNNLIRPAPHGCVPPLSVPTSPHSHPPCLYLCPCHARTHHPLDDHQPLGGGREPPHLGLYHLILELHRFEQQA